MTELKSCPFCGGEAVPVYSDKGSLYTSNILMLSAKGTVKCKKCEVRLQRIYSRVGKAIEAWNKRAESEWIPVTERLPEGKQEVLVTEYGDTDMGRRFDGRWVDRYGDKMKDVTAWMPLPESYTE